MITYHEHFFPYSIPQHYHLLMSLSMPSVRDRETKVILKNLLIVLPLFFRLAKGSFQHRCSSISALVLFYIVHRWNNATLTYSLFVFFFSNLLYSCSIAILVGFALDRTQPLEFVFNGSDVGFGSNKELGGMGSCWMGGNTISSEMFF